MSKIVALALILVLCTPIATLAGVVFQYSGGYTSYSNDKDELNFSRMMNAFYLGASVGRKTRFMIGPSYTMWNQSHKNSSGSESTMTMTEFGATLMIYLNRARNWKFSATYCMSVNGERKLAATEETLKGNAMRFGFGYHAPITDTFALGLNLGYQITNLTSSITNNTETKISQSYTQILPMLELAWRY